VAESWGALQPALPLAQKCCRQIDAPSHPVEQEVVPLLIVVGEQALVDIMASTPATTNAPGYARIVEEHALLRRLIGVAGEIAEIGYGMPEDVTKALDRAEAMVYDVNQRRVTDSIQLIAASENCAPMRTALVATRPLESLQAYRESLSRFVYHSGVIMQPLFTAAKKQPRRVVYAEGEDERVLRAAQIVVDEGLARPTLIGRPQVIEQRLQKLGLRVRPGREFELVNPESDPRFRDYWTTYHQLSERKGVTPEYARVEMRRHTTLIGAMLIYKGEADGMLCGTFGMHPEHLRYIEQVIGLRQGVRHYAAMNALMLAARNVFICDTYISDDPDPERIAEMTLLAAEEVRRFAITPKVALLSASNFGSGGTAAWRRVQPSSWKIA